MEEEARFFGTTHNPRTTLLNAMRHLATNADVEWQEVQASSIEQEYQEHTFTVTVSRFGCALHSHRFFEPGTGVRLGREGKTIQGSVVYSLKDYSRKLVEVGVGFDEDGWEFWRTVGSTTSARPAWDSQFLA